MKVPQSIIRLLPGRLVVLLYREISTMKSNTQNAKIKAITEKNLYLGLMLEVKRIMLELLITEESSTRRNHLNLVTPRPYL